MSLAGESRAPMAASSLRGVHQGSLSCHRQHRQQPPSNRLSCCAFLSPPMREFASLRCCSHLPGTSTLIGGWRRAARQRHRALRGQRGEVRLEHRRRVSVPSSGIVQGSPPGLEIDVSISDSVSESRYTCGRFKECTRSVLETLGCSEGVWHTSRETSIFQTFRNRV